MVGTKDYLVSDIKMTYACYVLGETNVRHLKFRIGLFLTNSPTKL